MGKEMGSCPKKQSYLEIFPLPPAEGNALLREPARVRVAC